MPTDNELVLTIREVLRQIRPGRIADTLEIADALVSECAKLGDHRSVEDIRALIRLEAAALGVSVVDR
jgi:hypothetical protein